MNEPLLFVLKKTILALSQDQSLMVHYGSIVRICAICSCYFSLCGLDNK